MNAPHRSPAGSQVSSQIQVDSSIHDQLLSWASRRAKSDYEVCVLLLAAARSDVHRALGFATTVQYGASVTSMSLRQVRERLRVGKALESLPALARFSKELGLKFGASACSGWRRKLGGHTL